MTLAPAGAEAGVASEQQLRAQASHSRGAGGSGYRKLEQLEPIHTALAAHRFREALDAATRIIETSDDRFASEKQARVIKANAYLLRSDARLGLHADDELVLRDEQAAAALGLRRAAYRAAARLVILASERATTPFERVALLAKAENYYRIAAELGDTVSMDILSVILRQRGEDAERMYWSFQVQLSRPRDERSEVLEKFERAFDPQDIESFAQVLDEYSLSGGVLASNIEKLPGRSYLTTFLNDLLLRRQLNFVWSAFYLNEVTPADATTTLESYRTLQKSIPGDPIAELYLLLPGRTRETDPLILSLSRKQIVEALSPGDQIIVRCGPLTHQATLWSVDRSTGNVAILDPFFEFWQPEHNSCVTRFRRIDYRHERKLVRVSLRELEPMLVAVMTLRDKRPENP
jgi:hypothetical protein